VKSPRCRCAEKLKTKSDFMSSLSLSSFCQQMQLDLKRIAGIAPEDYSDLSGELFVNNVDAHEEDEPAKAFFKLFAVDKFVEPDA